VKKYTDLPYLVRVDEGADGAYVAGKFLTAADLPAGTADGDGPDSENARFKTVLVDARTGRPVVPGGSLGHHYGEDGAGRWNLDLGDVDPLLSLADADADAAAGRGDGAPSAVEIALPRFDALDGSASTIRRGVPVRRVGGHLVTTVYDLLLAQYGVGRPGL